jgi:hypothetical protein
MDLVDLFYNYSPPFALLALVLIIAGFVVLAQGNSVGWVPLSLMRVGHRLCPLGDCENQRARAKNLRAGNQTEGVPATTYYEAVQNAGDRYLSPPEYDAPFVAAEEYTNGPSGVAAANERTRAAAAETPPHRPRWGCNPWRSRINAEQQ